MSKLNSTFFEMTGMLYIGTIPGPTNITGKSLTIKRVRIQCDGLVAGSISGAGIGFSYPAGGGLDDYDTLSTGWGQGNSLSLSVTSVGTDGTYLSVDVYFIPA